ncbi:T-cell-interacting, activating receptor on myeloid cells protein 1-like [Heteronotia binoei]|uniref:T-cell-interacting, activating receptor on myeloid cells protein 1-like n=1 Tax=Heteronotia binoei TaxID=13085 RepID=UPI0029312C22|nr:T-cell-interacting, activating receptor on myeloid cells protein 1-like [Heteronotia binoei]
MAKGYEAKFIISNTRISDAGIYQCSYYFKSSTEMRCSDYSDKAHINITDPSIPKPSIKVKPGLRNALHSSVSIECQGQEDDLNFFLRKANTGEILQESSALATGTATFHFFKVRSEDAGSYICQYHHRSSPFIWSEPSDPVKLIVEDPSLPKPSIKVKSGQHEVGKNVTINCKGPKRGLTFSLHKSKNFTALQMLKAEGNTAKFSLPLLRLEDAGNYTCQYYHGENPFVSSQPSDPAQVVVTGKKLG